MKTLAISGKGGTGKSTIAALIIRWLGEHKSKSILAVDADSNVNLNDLLGVDVQNTIGTIREEMRQSINKLPGGMTKQRFLEYKIHTSLVETPDFDLIAMGRPEGPGCYCYANNLLRDIMDTLGKNYAYLVIDNEAGMEHISRRTTQNVDYLFMVSNPTVTGIRTAGKISRLAEALAVGVREKYLILNRSKGTLAGPAAEAAREENLRQLCSIPEDDRLLSLDRAGKPIWPAVPESCAYEAMARALGGLITS